MKKQFTVAIAAMLVFGTLSLHAQSTTTKSSKVTTKRAKTASAKKVEETADHKAIRELQEKMEAQQSEIDTLKQANAGKDAALAAAQSTAATASTQAATAAAEAQSATAASQSQAEAVTGLKSTVTDLQTANVSLATTISTTKIDLNDSINSPAVLHYKGVTITPVAFFAFETVTRSRSIDSDVNTPFNATPYMGAAQAHTSETNFSGRQSRIGGLFTGDAGPFKLSGYIEADFLSAGVTSNDNQSNSYTLRQRQFWGQAATKSGFTLTGGQMWSLVTETKTSTDNRTEVLPMTIDAQYHVGFSWARQGAIRFQKRTGPWTAAISLEAAQTLFSATNQNQNFFFGNPGTGGGLYNSTANYSNNVAPDVIVKFTYDPKFGHYEIGGLARFFRDRYYPNQPSTPPTTAGAVNDTKTGGGFFADARFPVTPLVTFGFHALVGTGVGRYGTSTLPDTTVHPDGTLVPIKNYQGLYSMEFHPNKKLDLFGYAGAEYAQRTYYVSALPGSAGKLIGYAPPSSSNAGCNTETLPTANSGYAPGVPASCLGATRAVIEGTAGFTYRVYSSPKIGRLQYSLQYSYLTREGWSGLTSGVFGTPTATFGAPKATNNMVFTSMRYYIP
jgi:hypothetical protein